MTSRADAFKPEFIRDYSWKYPVRVATTAAGTLASSFENGDSVDGVTLATGDRILIKDQAAGAENGIYVVVASGAPARAYDMDTGLETKGSIVLVIAGTANGGKLFKNTNTATVTVGSTALTFAEIGGASLSFATPAIVLGSSTAAGAAGTVIRSDSTIVAFDATVPAAQAFGDSAATGSAAFAARRDHKHGMPTLPTTGDGARVYNSGAFSVGASSETIVTFDSERSDSAAYHSVSSNTGRLTVPTGKDGRYVIAGAVEWAASALGTLRRLSLRLNGTTYIAKTEITSIINAALPQDVSTVYDLVATDYVELIAFQDTVGSVNLSAAGNYSPEFGLGLIVSASAGGVSSGTSMPGSPSDGDLFNRTDLGLIFRYHSSGTRWLCICPHQVDFAMQDLLTPISANGSIRASGPYPITNTILIIGGALSIYVNTTNNGSNYWSFALPNATLNSSALSANAWGRVTSATTASIDLTTASTAVFDCAFTKTGAPGSAYPAANLIYKYIGT